MEENESKVLSREERDAFRGTTIVTESASEDHQQDGTTERDIYRDRMEQQEEATRSFRTYTVGGINGGCTLWMLIIMGIFFIFGGWGILILLPVYLIVAMVLFIVYCLYKLFF